MKTFNWVSGILIFFALNVSASVAQQLVQDSLVLNIQPIELESGKTPSYIDTVFDHRKFGNPRLIQIEQKNVYGIIPVDLHIKTTQPISHILGNILISEPSGQNKENLIGIEQVLISQQKYFLFFKRYRLNAQLKMYNISPTDSLIPIGDFVFDSGFFYLISKNKAMMYERLFDNFQRDVLTSVNAFFLEKGQAGRQSPYNFRPLKYVNSWLQLQTMAEFVTYSGGYLIDAYLEFSYPEVKKTFLQSLKTIRFRDENTFQSIEYGLMNLYLNYRLNNQFLFRAKSCLFIGLNRWKNMDTINHDLADAVIGDFSLSQSFQFFPIHKKTIVAGVGFNQHVYYIQSKGFVFKPGLLVNLGLQL